MMPFTDKHLMAKNADLVFTPAVRQAQAERGTAELNERRTAKGFAQTITPELAAFLAAQDTAFLATATAGGAPYVQHRGGPKGFIKVVDECTLAFADYAGNKQYITLGNLSENGHAFLFLIDFTTRTRIKIWGRCRVAEGDTALIDKLFDHGYCAQPERVLLFAVEAWDANCSSHITARFSEADIAAAASALRDRIVALEAENARLRELAGSPNEVGEPGITS
jgi:predicted pyridoxine 5'-phosphate oxidase superfamily flavin-nucleotide-binding protein